MRFRYYLRETLILAFFVVAYVVMFYPATFTMSEGFLGGTRQDPGIYIAHTRYAIDWFFSKGSPGFDAPFFYPFGKSLAYTDNYLLPGAISKIVFSLTDNFPLSYNVPLVLAGILNGYCMFLLARLATNNFYASLLVGFAFLTQSFIPAHLGHSQLQYIFFIPLSMYAALRFLMSRRIFPAFLIGGCVVGAFFCSAYYAMYTYLLSGLTLLLGGIIMFRSLRIRDFSLLAVANIPWLVLLLLVAEPYIYVRKAFSSIHPWVLTLFPAQFTSYLAASFKNYLWTSTTAHWGVRGDALYLGALPLLAAALLLLAMLLLRNPNSEFLVRIKSLIPKTLDSSSKRIILALLLSFSVAGMFYQDLFEVKDARMLLYSFTFWPILALLFIAIIKRGISKTKYSQFNLSDYSLLASFLFVFFLFASFGVIGGHGRNVPNTELYMLLFYNLPGFNALRALNRIGVVTCVQIALLASLFLSAVFSHLSKKRAYLSHPIALILLLLTAWDLRWVEFNASVDDPRPTAYDVLDSIPDDNPVISLPMSSLRKNVGAYSRNQSAYMIWTTPGGRKMLNGYSGKLPRFYQFKTLNFDSFPDESSLALMGQFIGLRYVVYNSRIVPLFNVHDFESKLAQFTEEVRELHRNQDGSFLFEISPIVTYTSGKFPELFMKPEPESRRILTMEARVVSSDANSEKTFSFYTGDSSKNLKPTETQQLLTIPNDGNWHKVTLEIPKSGAKVRPHRLRIVGEKFPKGTTLEIRKTDTKKVG